VTALLAVKDLAVRFVSSEVGTADVHALRGVSLEVPERGTLGLVGESGSGKSVTAHAILRLLPTPPAVVDRGEVMFAGQDLLRADVRALCSIRGGSIGVVFQEPMSALNPIYSVGWQVAEAVRLHRSISRRDARRVAIEALAAVGFPEAERRYDEYPHELSGGLRQRVLLAIATVNEPALIIADEPTTALDATLEAEVLDRLAALRRDKGTSLLLITHDLSVAAQVADRVSVLYAGRVVEEGTAEEVLRAPRHPYTRALVKSVPPTGSYRVRGKKRATKLPVIADPTSIAGDAGCSFEPRCSERIARCKKESPALLPLDGSARVACFLREASA
jgi:oligopeptide/dipeptide ABC transporter ATP-binding protein